MVLWGCRLRAFECGRAPCRRQRLSLAYVPMRPLTVLQAALAFSLLGSVLAVFVPTFIRNLSVSRMAEPLDGLSKLGGRATILATVRGVAQAYPESVGLTPADVPKGTAVQDPADLWLHPTWKELEFAPRQPHFFSYQFDSKNGPKRSHFTARAVGDLDGDGLYSQFEASGEYELGSEPVLNPIEIEREVE